jgi:hypothetical protein
MCVGCVGLRTAVSAAHWAESGTKNNQGEAKKSVSLIGSRLGWMVFSAYCERSQIISTNFAELQIVSALLK